MDKDEVKQAIEAYVEAKISKKHGFDVILFGTEAERHKQERESRAVILQALHGGMGAKEIIRFHRAARHGLGIVASIMGWV